MTDDKDKPEDAVNEREPEKEPTPEPGERMGVEDAPLAAEELPGGAQR